MRRGGGQYACVQTGEVHSGAPLLPRAAADQRSCAPSCTRATSALHTKYPLHALSARGLLCCVCEAWAEGTAPPPPTHTVAARLPRNCSTPPRLPLTREARSNLNHDVAGGGKARDERPPAPCCKQRGKEGVCENKDIFGIGVAVPRASIKELCRRFPASQRLAAASLVSRSCYRDLAAAYVPSSPTHRCCQASSRSPGPACRRCQH